MPDFERGARSVKQNRSRNALTRRDFIRLGAGAAATGATAKVTLLEPRAFRAATRAVPPSDTLRFASIGTGVRGCEDLKTALSCPGTEMVAVCDLYDGRLTAAQEVARKQLATTKDYRAVLDRKDVDFVIVATPDHWHAKIVEDACAAGKDVYCEKPMSHTVEEGFAMAGAAEKYNRIVQVGSQRRSGIVFAKAREIYASGALGQVTAIEAWIDRNDASGAWVYPVPPDASEQTIDWNRQALLPLALLPGLRRRPARGPLRPPADRHSYHYRRQRAARARAFNRRGVPLERWSRCSRPHLDVL